MNAAHTDLELGGDLLQGDLLGDELLLLLGDALLEQLQLLLTVLGLLLLKHIMWIRHDGPFPVTPTVKKKGGGGIKTCLGFILYDTSYGGLGTILDFGANFKFI